MLRDRIGQTQSYVKNPGHCSGQDFKLVCRVAFEAVFQMTRNWQVGCAKTCNLSRSYLEASGQCRRPGQCARVQIQLQSVRLRAARLRGRVRAARLRRAGLQAAGCKVAACRAARLQAARCKVAGCKGAGDRLRSAKLQAPVLQSESEVLLRFDMQKRDTPRAPAPATSNI